MLVIGIGNELRGDDAAGILAIRKIRELNLPNVITLEHSGEGTSLMELWKNQDQVLVIDAAVSGAEPGIIQWHETNQQPLPTGLFHFSTHAIGLTEAIELSRSLQQLPASITVCAIEGKHFGTGDGVSSEVISAIDRVVTEILRLCDFASHR